MILAMTLTEGSLLAIAIVQVLFALVVIAAGSKLLKILQGIHDFVEKLPPIMDRIGDMSDELVQIGRDARQVEQRVKGTVNQVLDQVEPPVRQFAGVLAGVRAGANRLFHSAEHEYQRH